MSASPSIRHATVGDSSALASLTGDLGYPVFEPADYQRTVEAILAGEDRFLLVAQVQDTVVGYVLAHENYRLGLSGPMMTVDELVVSSKLRGRGVGTALVESLRSLARDRGSRRTELITARNNDSYARGFYSAIGFHEVDSAVLRIATSDP